MLMPENLIGKKVVSLMYHDIIASERDVSGFMGPTALRYRIEKRVFEGQMLVLQQQYGPQVDHTRNLVPLLHRNFILTLDDGGVGGHANAADALEALNLHGNFFIVPKFVGSRGFMSKSQIRDLHERGHGIGTHSMTHPDDISKCSDADLVKEWRESSLFLSDVVGKPVTIASVPGGRYTRRVAEIASSCGLRVMFTSQPTVRVTKVDECAIVGRFWVWHDSSPMDILKLMQMRIVPRATQAILWRSKEMMKSLAGEKYGALQKSLQVLRR